MSLLADEGAADPLGRNPKHRLIAYPPVQLSIILADIIGEVSSTQMRAYRYINNNYNLKIVFFRGYWNGPSVFRKLTHPFG